MELRNNTILITGGASGIGLEFAKRLLDLGNTVIITGRDQAKLEKAQKQFPEIHIFQSDVGNSAEIKSLYEEVTKQFSDLDILINNAGVMRMLNMQDKNADFEKITNEIEINLTGTILMVQHFLPHLTSKRSAAIINVSSGLAFIPLYLTPVYCATKAGVHSYTQSLRVQLKNTNVKVFEVVPPSTATPLMSGVGVHVDSKSSSHMPVDQLVDTAIKGIIKDKLEILPGKAALMKFLSRLAPEFGINFITKAIEKTLAKGKKNKKGIA
jgi:uncharacterized oxidoreductase